MICERKCPVFSVSLLIFFSNNQPTWQLMHTELLLSARDATRSQRNIISHAICNSLTCRMLNSPCYSSTCVNYFPLFLRHHHHQAEAEKEIRRNYSSSWHDKIGLPPNDSNPSIDLKRGILQQFIDHGVVSTWLTWVLIWYIAADAGPPHMDSARFECGRITYIRCRSLQDRHL